jgi:hypothetical protein
MKKRGGWAVGPQYINTMILAGSIELYNYTIELAISINIP